MFVVDRTSVQVYYPQNKTSIHVPAKSAIDNAIIDWILSNITIELLNPNDQDNMVFLQNRLTGAGFTVDTAVTKLHVEHIKLVTAPDYVADDWNFLEARTHELNVITKAIPDFINPNSKFLEFHDADLSKLDQDLFGKEGLFSQVVAVTRLTETRVLHKPWS
jgi:hypothetical protein